MKIKKKHDLNTHFAPAIRLDKDQVRGEFRILDSYSCSELFNAVPHLVLVLNEYRQLVFANEPLKEFLGLSDLDQVLGMRPGELFGCVNAFEEEGGCGTTPFCAQCGAVRAILSSIEGTADAQECHMLRRSGDSVASLDLNVTATPIEVEDRSFTVFTVLDVTHESRRRVLERIFFHDVINTAGSLAGLTEVITEALPPDQAEYAGLMLNTVGDLLDEIQAQRDLLAAENRELDPEFGMTSARAMAEDVVHRFSHHHISRGKTVGLSTGCQDVPVETDPTLVKRILGNMVKNALEAIGPGLGVTLSWTAGDGRLTYRVHNPGAMDQSTCLNVFKRTFSTKGKGRGLGTYSMRLLAESYLHGRVGFTSTEEEGTEFFLVIPLVPESEPGQGTP